MVREKEEAWVQSEADLLMHIHALDVYAEERKRDLELLEAPAAGAGDAAASKGGGAAPKALIPKAVDADDEDEEAPSSSDSDDDEVSTCVEMAVSNEPTG
jgi:hypothetical protein